MIDLHAHILPGVDDGPAALQESVEMCRMAATSGCRALIATPHQRREWATSNPEALRGRLEELRNALDGAPDLYLGAEIRADEDLLVELERDDRGGLLSLAGSCYLLIEVAAGRPRRSIEGCVHELVLNGWTPILAHPEVTRGLGDDLALATWVTKSGGKFQVTAASVTGDFGRQPQRLALTLIDRGLVDFVASDAHSPRWRPPGLQRAFAEIGKRWGEAMAWRLTRDNPLAVIEAGEIPA